MNTKQLLLLILGVDAFLLFFQTSNMSISYEEASLLYQNSTLLSIIVNFSLKLCGHSDLSLRLPMIFFHLMSALLIYLISEKYILVQRNRIWLVFVFVLLPGNVSAAVVVNDAGMLIFGLLFFVYIYDKVPLIFSNMLLLFYSLLGISFAYLFLGLAVYYIREKKNYNVIYMLFLYLLTSYLYGFEIAGAPTGHFLDAIAVYSAIFTPIIFIYMFYILYRKYLTSKVDMLWFISSIPLIISLILSFRQRVAIEYFAPYLMIALPLVAQTFISSYRVRLKIYRRYYKLAFILSFVFLILNTLVVFFNKELYQFIENPKKHFAYEFHIAKELSNKLKDKNIYCVSTDEKMQYRLEFYGVCQCNENILNEIGIDSERLNNVTVSYNNNIVYRANVTKLNNK